jgi:hypothetical protein
MGFFARLFSGARQPSAIPQSDLRIPIPDIPAAHEPDRFAEYRMWRFVEQQGRGGRGAPRDERGRFTKGGCGGGN